MTYADTDLADAGWTYGYISPANFDLPNAVVHDGVLAPDGPGFKALVVLAEQNLTLYSAAALQGYADAGLPILLVGGEPGYYATDYGREQETVLNAIGKLRASSGVHSVAVGELVPTLASLGLVPNIGIQTNGTLWTTWREDKATGIDYAFVFGDTNATSGDLMVQTTKTPYVLDAWTGERRPLLHYSVSDNVTTIPLGLNGNETATTAFAANPLPRVDVPAQHITKLSAEGLGSTYSCDGGIVAHVHNSVVGQVEMSSGQTISIDGASVPPALPLADWTLTAEHWDAPADIYDAATVAFKHNTTHQLPALVSWLQIPALANTSGIGYYTTTFSWPPTSESASDPSLGAYISFPPILHAVTLYINGERTVPINYVNPVVDISSHLKQGGNEVLVVVPTTMRNYLLSIQPQLINGGQNVTSLTSPTDNGLVGEVRVVPFGRVRLDA